MMDKLYNGNVDFYRNLAAYFVQGLKDRAKQSILKEKYEEERQRQRVLHEKRVEDRKKDLGYVPGHYNWLEDNEASV